LGEEAQGDGDLVLTGTAEPQDAKPNEIALAVDEKYADGLATGNARSALLWENADWQALGLDGAICVSRGRVAMAALTRSFDPGPDICPGQHSSAVIDPTATVAPGAAIGPFVVIGKNVKIGANARIASHVTIAEGAVIGSGRNVQIGSRFVGHPGCVIGADGFSFVTAEKSRAEAARETLGDSNEAEGQPWLRIHSLGSVIVGDDVEIGCNSCIDAGTIRPTLIGNGCKIDNQVQVAHNTEVGRDCLFAAQVGIAGSVKIGDNVIFGGQVGVVDNIFVGDRVVAGGGTVILSNVPKDRVLLGYPAMKMQTQVETYKALRRLPRLAADVAALKKAVPKPDGSD